MNVNFKFNEAAKNENVYFDQVFAEKVGGGLVANPSFDLLPSTAVGYDADGNLQPIKVYQVVEAVNADATAIKIAKGSGVVVGDVLAYNGKGVACSAVDYSNDDYDLVTISFATAIPADALLYQAAAAKASGAAPKYAPVFVVGEYVCANHGDQAVRLVNGANLRKETARVTPEIVALLKGIQLV